jgi:CRISPR-associated exonuclease Cas4
MDYKEEEFLPLSGIQHFLFCRRQWALIHVEQQWKENYLTAEGRQLHNKVDDPFIREKREGVIFSRSVPICSHRLGLSGICDLIEFHPSSDGVALPGQAGSFLPIPVEYKHGEPKIGLEDITQVVAQVCCLEEMFSFTISQAYLFYGKTRHREIVNVTSENRNLVEAISLEMHEMYSIKHTPKVRVSKACQSCSLKDICLPQLLKKKSVKEYIHTAIFQEKQ